MSGPVIKTPRGKIITIKSKSGEAKAELKWNTSEFTGGGSSWQGRYTTAQEFVDGEILRLSEPYIPKATGMLVASGILGTKVGSGEVQWIALYARKQYYSKRKPGSQTGPLRGPYWFERMKKVHKDRIIKGARRFAGKS